MASILPRHTPEVDYPGWFTTTEDARHRAAIISQRAGQLESAFSITHARPFGQNLPWPDVILSELLIKDLEPGIRLIPAKRLPEHLSQKTEKPDYSEV